MGKMNPFWLIIHIFQRGWVETTNYRQAPWWFFTMGVARFGKQKNPMPDWFDVPSPLIDVPDAQIGDACGLQEPWKHRREQWKCGWKHVSRVQLEHGGGLFFHSSVFDFTCALAMHGLLNAWRLLCFCFSTLPGTNSGKTPHRCLEGDSLHLKGPKNICVAPKKLFISRELN